MALYASLGMIAATASAQVDTPTENISPGEDRKAVAVTIYNESLALIREERDLNLKAGRNLVALREVSGKIDPATASLRSLSGSEFSLREQNFDFDLLTPASLLKKYVGKAITVARYNQQTGKESSEQATVLANNDGVVLKYADRIETNLPNNARIVYGSVPTTLRDQPTLVVDFDSNKSGQQRAELSYLSSGFSWRADYVATLASDEKTLDLAGWVTLTNQSGTAYDNAKLQLVAGDVNRVRADFNSDMMMLRPPPPSPGANSMAQEELFEYHLYTLGRPTTLRNQQTKQVALLSAAHVPVTKEYRMDIASYYYNESVPADSGSKRNVTVFINWDNKGGNLGVPLPKGIVRVYKSDRQGSPQFIGEDRIDHTPKNDTVRLQLGKAFDVTGNWKRTDFSRVSEKVIEQEVAIEISNAKDIPVTVRIVEPIPRDWKILKENYASTKSSGNSAMWDVPVSANSKTTLTYRVRIAQ
jgi:hypothetical protein